MLIPRENIIPDPNNPRKTFDPEMLSELGDSMRGEGPDQPLIVRLIAGEKYMIVTGERRYRADSNENIECVIRDVNDRTARIMQYRENIHRVGVAPIELGKSWVEHRKEYGMTQEALAKEIGLTKGRSTLISRCESMYLNLAGPAKKLFHSGEINQNAAYQLSTIPNSERQLEVGEGLVETKLNDDQTRQVVAEAKKHPMKPASEIVRKVVKEEESVQVEKAISVIPQPERKEETRRAIEAYDVSPKLASKVAEKVVSQPERSPQEVIEEIQEAEGASKRSLAAQKGDSISKFYDMLTKQMKAMSSRLAELKDLPAENAGEFLVELDKLFNTVSEALGRLNLPDETVATEPEAVSVAR